MGGLHITALGLVSLIATPASSKPQRAASVTDSTSSLHHPLRPDAAFVIAIFMGHSGHRGRDLHHRRGASFTLRKIVNASSEQRKGWSEEFRDSTPSFSSGGKSISIGSSYAFQRTPSWLAMAVNLLPRRSSRK
jgi:hypothetical protein